MIQSSTAAFLSRIARALLVFPLLVAAVAGGTLVVVHERGVARTDAEWHGRAVPPPPDVGSTRSLALLPLVNWHVAHDGLRSEMGVSWLIRTDTQTILFDLGHNASAESPSPLEHNMTALGIDPAGLDAVFISHAHFDHVGGRHWERQRSFSLGNGQQRLAGVDIYTPVPMTYPGATPVHTPLPRALGPGVATTGTIPRRLFMGRIDEQALVVNVEGKGLVLVVGCGHQTLTRLLDRVRESFSEPLYAVVGDLHYPIPDGRLSLLGINAQRFFASGHAPWRPLRWHDVEADIARLGRHPLGLVALGGHDSSDRVIARFREAFGERYRDVRVGEWIVVAGAPSG